MDTIISDFYTDVPVREVRAEERWVQSDGDVLPGISDVPVEQKRLT